MPGHRSGPVVSHALGVKVIPQVGKSVSTAGQSSSRLGADQMANGVKQVTLGH